MNVKNWDYDDDNHAWMYVYMYVACISRYSNPAGTQGYTSLGNSSLVVVVVVVLVLVVVHSGASTLVQACSVSFTGEFSPNFDLKNLISTYTKDFSWGKKKKKKTAKFTRFSRVFLIKSPDFHDKFQ
jgi:hypothetical protein